MITAAEAEAVRIVQGDDRLRSWKPETGAEKPFGGGCAGVRPSVRQFVSYAASWEELPDDGLPRFPESRT